MHQPWLSEQAEAHKPGQRLADLFKRPSVWIHRPKSVRSQQRLADRGRFDTERGPLPWQATTLLSEAQTSAPEGALAKSRRSNLKRSTSHRKRFLFQSRAEHRLWFTEMNHVGIRSDPERRYTWSETLLYEQHSKPGV